MVHSNLFVFVLWRSYHCLYLFYEEFIVFCICFIEILSLFVFILWRAYRCLHLFYFELINVCIYFIEILALFVFVLSRAYSYLYLFYGELIVVCIYFILSLLMFVFILSRSYRCLYLFYRELIVICICFIAILSLFVYALSRAYRCLYMLYRELIVCIYCLLVMSVKLITVLEWIRFLCQYVLCAWGPTSMKFRIQFIGDTIIILWIRYYLWYSHFLWISWFFRNREIRNSTNMCHHIYLPIQLTSLNWNEFAVSLIIKSGVVLCSIWRDDMFTISILQGFGVADRLKYLLW
jgi:hypothetical protein